MTVEELASECERGMTPENLRVKIRLFANHLRDSLALVAGTTPVAGDYVHSDPGEGSWWEESGQGTQNAIVAAIQAFPIG